MSRDRHSASEPRLPLTVPLPAQPERRRPLAEVRLSPTMEERELKRRLADALLALVPRVNAQDEHLVENTAQLVVVSRAVNRMAALLEGAQTAPTHRDRLPTLPDFDPDLTPHGGIRFSPEQWDEVQKRISDQGRQFERMRHELDVKEAEVRAKEEERERIEAAHKKERAEQDRKREDQIRLIKIVLSAATLGGSIITWLVTHFGHL